MRQSVPLRAALALAVSTLAGACASSGNAVPRPFPLPRNAGSPGNDVNENRGRIQPPSLPQSSAVDGYALVGTALSLRGVPYRNGGADPQGFDCSGFTQYVFAQYGVALPRGVRDQFQVGKTVRPEDLAPGDIVFFSTTDPGPSHVAIVIGGDEFVHAPSSTGVVRVEHLSVGYWAQRYIGARRLN